MQIIWVESHLSARFHHEVRATAAAGLLDGPSDCNEFFQCIYEAWCAHQLPVSITLMCTAQMLKHVDITI